MASGTVRDQERTYSIFDSTYMDGRDWSPEPATGRQQVVYFAQNHERPEVKHVVQEPTEEEKGWARASGGPFRTVAAAAERAYGLNQRTHCTNSIGTRPWGGPLNWTGMLKHRFRCSSNFNDNIKWKPSQVSKDAADRGEKWAGQTEIRSCLPCEGRE